MQKDVLDELLNEVTRIRMPVPMQNCKLQWIKFHIHVIDKTLQLAQKKEKVYNNHHLDRPYNETTITVNVQKLKVVDKFSYLGSTVHTDDEITARTAKISVAFEILYGEEYNSVIKL